MLIIVVFACLLVSLIVSVITTMVTTRYSVTGKCSNNVNANNENHQETTVANNETFVYNPKTNAIDTNEIRVSNDLIPYCNVNVNGNDIKNVDTIKANTVTINGDNDEATTLFSLTTNKDLRGQIIAKENSSIKPTYQITADNISVTNMLNTPNVGIKFDTLEVNTVKPYLLSGEIDGSNFAASSKFITNFTKYVQTIYDKIYYFRF